MDHGPGELCSRPQGSPEGDIHNKVEPHRPRHQQPQHEFGSCIRQLRLDSYALGRGERRMCPHTHKVRISGE